MKITDSPDLPVPADATADDWCHLPDHPEDLIRFLSWAKLDTDKVGGVEVAGSQYATAASIGTSRCGPKTVKS